MRGYAMRRGMQLAQPQKIWPLLAYLAYAHGQTRQTRPNSRGGGVAEGQPRFDKGGVAITFYFLTVKGRTF